MINRYFMGIFVIVLTLTRVAGAVPIDRIAAVVDQEIITESELQGGSYPLRRIIENKMILQAAGRMGVHVTDAERERALADIGKPFPNRDAFVKAVTASAGSWDDYLERLKIEILFAKLLHHAIDANLVVTDEEVRAHYERYPMHQENQIRLEQILFSVSDFDRETARQRAESARREIAEGASFDQIAEAGKRVLLGPLKKGDLLPEVEQIVFGLDVGWVSPVIATPSGFHIFRMQEKIQGGVQPFESARPAIMALLSNNKRNLLAQQWFSQLRERAFIEVK